MPKMVLLAEYLDIGSNDLSSYGAKAELAINVEEKDVTVFTSQGWKEVLGGIAAGSLAVGFKNDVSASALDSIMWPLLRSVQPFKLRMNKDVAVSSSNPQWQGSVLITGWKVGGSVGDVNETDLTFPTSGLVTRTTST
jgi:hypothetical protein